jgi:hypothetical protein
MAKNRQRRHKSVSVPRALRNGSAGVLPDSPDVGETPALRFGRLANWQGPILIAVAAVAMALWTWGTWPDVLIDFGVERYIPWRLAEGEVLYRDISFHNGPLSQYFNAVCFRVFGSNLRTLVFCNLALLAALIWLLYYMFRQVGRRSAATAACLVFVLLFAFAQFVGIGNYNYVCPYAHEMTHGLLLSLVALVAAWPRGSNLPSPSGRGVGGEGGAGTRGQGLVARACQTVNASSPRPSPLPEGEGTLPRVAACILSGLALGLVFLTKAEVFFAAALATGTALLVGLWFERPGWRGAIVRVCCFSVGLVIPPAIAFLCLASAMPARQAWLGTLGSWVVAVRSEVRDLPFYRMGQGTDRVWENALAMLRMTALYAVVLVPAGVVGLLARRRGQYRTAIAAGAFVVTVVLLWISRAEIDWFELARPLPLLILVAGIAVGACFWFHRHEPSAQRRFVRQISLLVFALALLAKMFLNARVFHYGFVLAMPATLVLVVAAFDWVPVLIDRRGGFGWVFSASVAALLAVTGSVYLSVQSHWIAQKAQRVGSGGDAFWADVYRGVFVEAAAEQIAARAAPNTTLAVLPEGIMLNCLTGLRNPTSHLNFMPVELMLFGEDSMVESFKTHPPDLIALVHKDTSELGFQFFGRDYGRQLGDWIRENYRPWCQIGAEPLKTDEFGILLLERNEDRKGGGRAK